MIATGDENCKVVVTGKLYCKPASQLIITPVSIDLAVRMLTHSTTGNGWFTQLPAKSYWQTAIAMLSHHFAACG